MSFAILQNGLFIKEVSFSNISIHELYIKWNNKLDVSLKEIKIDDVNSNNGAPIPYKKIANYLQSLPYATHWFNSIIIEHIVRDDINVSFEYIHKNGNIVLHTPTIKANALISLKDGMLDLNIKKFRDNKRDITLDGHLYLDTKSTKLFSKLNLDIAKEADLTLYTVSDFNKLTYSLVSHKDITSITKIIKIAHLPKAANYWAYDAIGMKDITLINASGFIDFNALNDAYKNIKIQAIANNIHYAYNPKLDKIDAKTVELKFFKGVLYIKPKNAYTYGMYLGKSWLKIDFTKKEELLTLHLLFDAKINKDVLNILHTYKIKLPFLQKKGIVKTDLKLQIGLETIDVDAQGDFYTKKANFNYVGLNIDIFNAHIKLNNNDVSIKNMSVKYKNIAKAKVNVTYNAKKGKGKIDFTFTEVSLDGAKLKKSAKLQKATYKISPNADSITIAPSIWNYKDQTIHVDGIVMPFDLKELKLHIPTTLIEVPGTATAFVSGSVMLKTMLTELDLDILHFNYDGVKLTQSNTPLKVTYNKKIVIDSKDDIFFSVSGTKYKLSRLYMQLDKNIFSIKHTNINIGKYITAKLYAKYNTKTNLSQISLSNFILTNPNNNNVLYKNNKILLSSKIEGNTIKVNSNEIDASFTSKDSGWKLHVNSLARVTKNSKFLKSLFLSKGDFTLYRNKNDKYMRFTSNVQFPYKVLLSNGKPTNEYKINGKIYKEKIYLNVNKNLQLEYKDSVNISMHNSPINILELLRFMKEYKSIQKDKTAINILVHGDNSYLYLSKDRKILYETLNLQYFNKILTAQLNYKDGSAGLKLQNKNFHLYGQNFNDEFMNKLLYKSKFTNGTMNFSLSGTTDKYSGVMYIKKTTIKDYKSLNNILAFINTVPSLITFKLPGYSKYGLLVDKAYVNFEVNGDIAKISDIYLDSKEMDILGKGTVNLKDEKLNIMLNLKTDLGSQISKVPVVGYILLDGDTLSTTLSIKGNYENPKIKSHIATNIVVAPLNIIKRTLLLPYKLINDAIKENNATK